MILILAGLLLLILAMPTKSSSENGNKSEQEKRLQTLLEETEGVDRVQVMITQSGKEESIFSEEKKSCEGIVIAYAGRQDAETKNRIMEVVEVLFDVQPHKIKIVKMKG